jgi:hypothetical protein
MNTQIITVTPDIADHLLKFNNGNRKLRRRTVSYFAQCLRDGEFHTTHQGIAIAGSLLKPVRLFDGQHRLAAVLATGIPAVMQISEHCTKQCFSNVDNGLPRSLGDRTSLGSHTASVCRVIFELIQGSRTVLKASVDKVLSIHSIIKPDAACVPNQHIRGFSLAPFTAAFIMQQHVYGFNHSALFQSTDAESNRILIRENPCLFAFKVRQGHARNKRQQYRAAEAFWLIWQCVENPTKSKAVTSKNSVDLVVKTFQKHWPDLVNAVRGEFYEVDDLVE